MFFELREYHCWPGKRDEWAKVMETEIIPFQISKGMVIVGSFVGEQDEDTYIWIRRFESEEERVALYKAVYESDYWQKEMSPRVGELLDRSKIKVTRLNATPKSVLQ
ncbi:MAG: NIPSNAP family protein [Caldilineaceae bacterium]